MTPTFPESSRPRNATNSLPRILEFSNWVPRVLEFFQGPEGSCRGGGRGGLAMGSSTSLLIFGVFVVNFFLTSGHSA